MKRKITPLVFGCMSIMLLLCGCSQMEEKVTWEVERQAESSLHEREEYKLYEEYKENGLLNENNDYTYPVPDDWGAEEEAVPEGRVTVSLARNTYLKCAFRINSDDLVPTEDTKCFLAPGDSLYALEVTTENPASNLYAFSEFRIYSYDSENRRVETPFAVVKADTGLLFTVPADYSGSGFSVEPIGAYADRTITVESHYINEQHQTCQLRDGKWTVNDAPLTEKTRISPVVSYRVVYDYSHYAEMYYVTDTYPEYWFINEDEHLVTFPEVMSNEESVEYSVTMHPFVTIHGSNNSIKRDTVTVYSENSGAALYSGREKSFSVGKLRAGEKIYIRVGAEYMVTATGVNAGNGNPIDGNEKNGYEYMIVVPETCGDIQISVKKRNSVDDVYSGYEVDNADLILCRADGTVVEVGDELPGDSEKVTATIRPHGGYYISGKNADAQTGEYSREMKYSEFAKKIKSIIESHPACPYIAMTINREDECGSCIYKLDGKEISGDTITARAGQKLELTFTVDTPYKIVRKGWITDTWSKLMHRDSISENIEVTEDMNDTTISRESFGILTEKEGE